MEYTFTATNENNPPLVNFLTSRLVLKYCCFLTPIMIYHVPGTICSISIHLEDP